MMFWAGRRKVIWQLVETTPGSGRGSCAPFQKLGGIALFVKSGFLLFVCLLLLLFFFFGKGEGGGWGWLWFGSV